MQFVVSLFLAALCILTLPGQALSGVRRAFLVGNTEYQNGLPELENAANDAEEMKKKLEQTGLNFRVTLHTNLKDKAAFLAALDEFAASIDKGKGDEVLFFYSGHGFGTEKGGNYFLPTSLKGEGKFFQELPASEKNELKDGQQRRTAYGNWISENAVAESEVERRLLGRDPDVLIMIADACRDLLPTTKGAGLLAGLTVPKQTAEGVFRFYSARPDQKSLESIGKQTARFEKEGGRSKGAAAKPKSTSLFTSALLRYIDEPGKTIGAMADEVKRTVSEQARSVNHQQHPDFVDRLDGTFYFRPLEAVDAVCASADAIVYRLSQDILRGRVTRPNLLSERDRMAPCGKYDELSRLLNLYDQGVGTLSAQPRSESQTFSQRHDAGLDSCDAKAASPLDPNRPQRIQGVGIQEFAVAALANPDVRDKSRGIIQEAIDACSDARNKRQKVARFSFNLGRSYFALATLTNGDDQTELLHKAFLNHIEAANQGYVAAYNDLAIMYETGQVVELHAASNKLVRLAPNRERAVELYTKGANLGHVVAQYNLGLKYKRGDLGLNQSDAKAYYWFAKAAEANYAPAMIQAAIALGDAHGVDRDPQRAVQLLTSVAQRGSAEAMYYLGNIYAQGRTVYERRALDLPASEPEALIWYARAAELGHRGAQEELARMLMSGKGVPTAQREASGRYWRLAAQNGSERAQRQLASLLRDGKIPFRPDLGGQELTNLYAASVARGDWNAAMDYAKLHRTGFFVGDTQIIQRDPAQAVELYDKALEISKRADRDSENADPEREVLPVFEIVDMHDKGETSRADGSKVVSEERIADLKAEYGDPSRKRYFRVPTVSCPQQQYYWVLIWDSTRKESPAEWQFDWFERHAAQKRVDCKIEKPVREEFKRQFDKAQKDKASFVDLMVARYEEQAHRGTAQKRNR